MGTVMLDLDQLEESKERASFKLFGKTYPIPSIGYGKTLKLEDLRKGIKKGTAEEDLRVVLESIMKVVFLIIPELESQKDKIEEALSLEQLNALANLIFDEMKKRASDEGAVVEEDQKELIYYRQKCGDEYRKKQDRKKEKGTKGKKK